MNITIANPSRQTWNSIKKHQVITVCGIALTLAAVVGAGSFAATSSNKAGSNDAVGASFSATSAVEFPMYVPGDQHTWLAGSSGNPGSDSFVAGTSGLVAEAPKHISSFGDDAENQSIYRSHGSAGIAAGSSALAAEAPKHMSSFGDDADYQRIYRSQGSEGVAVGSSALAAEAPKHMSSFGDDADYQRIYRSRGSDELVVGASDAAGRPVPAGFTVYLVETEAMALYIKALQTSEPQTQGFEVLVAGTPEELANVERVLQDISDFGELGLTIVDMRVR